MKLKPNVKEVLPRAVPTDYRLGIDGWSFSKEKLAERQEDGTRKLLTLDVSISPDQFVEKVNQGDRKGLVRRVNKFYDSICPHNCPGCFEKGDVTNYLLSFEDIQNYIEQGLELGLESIKFLGPGELIANPDLFKILDYLDEKDIKTIIFTKGGTLGDDELAKRYQGMSSEELVKKVCSYDNTRFGINFRTFDEKKANNSTNSQASNYARARNRAVELLAKEGMNSDLYSQRLGLIFTPVTADSIDDTLEVFKWGTERNIPVTVTPTMVSGRGKKLMKEAQTPEFQEKLVQLYTDINTYLVEIGALTIDQLKEEGVSSYAGTTPCTQLSCGMFVRKDGVVQFCPGNDSGQFKIADDVRAEPLRNIWGKHAAKIDDKWGTGSVLNNGCVKDGYSIPVKLYDDVLKRLDVDGKKD
ncbi:MAG: radical SAM protein [archaeon]|nr:radical SAM protein [Nanoarchaeota archaeon]